jgi:APA family basic amino acid/polyamine antiporter
MLSFAIAGAICACAALAYAEVGTMIRASGSAYTYSYVVFGELLAWIVGWSLILEYSLVVSAVAVGWSGYASPLLGIPMAFASGPELGGIANIPAVLIIALVAGMLIFGTKESATVNAILVVIKLLALLMFIIIAFGVFNPANFDPFMPMGFSKQSVGAPDGSTVEVGVMAAAAIIFFAFYGFDAIATASEEAKNPDRDLAIGIVGSMLLCVVIYIAVAAAAIGALATTVFADSPEPLALILRAIGEPTAAKILALSAAITLPTVILAFFFGQSRIFLAMARDGLLPEKLAHVSKRGSPTRITIFTALIVSVIAALFPLSEIAALANAGTLTAFIAVCAAMMFLRRKQPDAPRKFRAPAGMVVGALGILGCIYLLFSLPTKTQEYFIIWNLFGVVVYWLYGSRQAAKARAAR